MALSETLAGRGGRGVVCLHDPVAAQGSTRGYLGAGNCPSGTNPILKRLFAIAGDEVELKGKVLTVEGRVVDGSQRLVEDSHGRPLELHPLGRRIVCEGEIWDLGVYPNTDGAPFVVRDSV